jgi:hypothetical protein
MPQAGTRLGDHYERLVRRECDAIGEMQPGQHDLDPPTQVAAQMRSWPNLGSNLLSSEASRFV